MMHVLPVLQLREAGDGDGSATGEERRRYLPDLGVDFGVGDCQCFRLSVK